MNFSFIFCSNKTLEFKTKVAKPFKTWILSTTAIYKPKVSMWPLVKFLLPLLPFLHENDQTNDQKTSSSEIFCSCVHVASLHVRISGCTFLVCSFLRGGPRPLIGAADAAELPGHAQRHREGPGVAERGFPHEPGAKLQLARGAGSRH